MKEQQFVFECTRLHGLAGTVKQRHAKVSRFVEGEPVAVSALHCIEPTHWISHPADRLTHRSLIIHVGH